MTPISEFSVEGTASVKDEMTTSAGMELAKRLCDALEPFARLADHIDGEAPRGKWVAPLNGEKDGADITSTEDDELLCVFGREFFGGVALDGIQFGELRRARDAHREAAAFLSHPVDTGQGVGEEPFKAFTDELSRHIHYDDNAYKCAIQAYLIASRPPLASVEGDVTLDWPHLVQLGRCLGLFASAIKSGEGWSEACQSEYDKANLAIKEVFKELAQSGRSSAEDAK